MTVCCRACGQPAAAKLVTRRNVNAQTIDRRGCTWSAYLFDAYRAVWPGGRESGSNIARVSKLTVLFIFLILGGLLQAADPNYHVVNGVSNMTVTFWNGDAYQGKAVGTDAYSDPAIVAVNGALTSEFVPLMIVSSSAVSVGDPVYAIGAPYGLSGSFTYGIISQLGRTIQEATTGNYSIAE